MQGIEGVMGAKHTYNRRDVVFWLIQSVKQNSTLDHGWKVKLQRAIGLFRLFILLSILFYGAEEATAQTKTRVIGAANWNTASTWIQLRTGTVAFTNTSVTVTGTGTLFLSELQAGDVLMMNATPGTIRGTIASIQTNTSLTLSVAATATVATAAYGRQAVPGSGDNVEIGNTTLSGVSNITLDAASATIASLTFIIDAYAHSLTHAGTNNLNITGAVSINQPTTNLTVAWNINAGSATVSGLISFVAANNANRKITCVLTSGTLNAFGGISFSAAGTASNRIIDMSGGAGVLNLKGALTSASVGTLNAGTSGSIFNYTDNVSAQTINFFAASTYDNLHLNNTNAAGATLSAAITTANVTGNIRVLSGTMYNGGFAIALNNNKIFEVANSAVFRLTGTSAMVTGTTITKTFGATSTVDYNGAAQAVSTEVYGHLTLSNSGVKTLPGTMMSIAGNFTMSGTASATALNSITIGGDVTLNSGTTLVAGSFIHNVAGNWTNNGGTFTPGGSTVIFNGTGAQSITGSAAVQSFNNLVVAKSAGTLLAVNGSTTTLRTNDFTQTSGDFTAPFTMNIIATATSSVTLNAGIFTAGIIISITGNWTNNGGTFTPGSSIVVFNGAGAQAISGTAASQTFYNVALAKSAGTLLSVGGSTTTLTLQDFTQTTGDFTAPAVLNINGNRIHFSGVFIAGATTSITGDWTTNGGTINLGSNTVIFNGSGAQAINGTAASQTFYNVTLAKTGGTLSIGGSTTTLTVNNLTETTGNFTAPATLNINGDLVLTTGTFTAGTTISIQGNWTNNGGTFTSGTSLVSFIGTGTKILGGSNVTSFYNLTLNTTAVGDIVQLSSDATVNSLLSLTKGVFDLNGRSLFVTSGLAGAITRTNGYILSEKTDNSSKIIWSIGSNLTSHTYPFGTASGSYIPFILNLTAGDIGNVTLSTYPTAANNTPYPTAPVAVTNMNGYSGSDNSANAVDRFWQIDKDGPSGTATLTFTATSAEVGAILLPIAQQWRSTPTLGWNAPLPGQTNTATSATVPGVTTFSPWTMSSQAVILPIQLVSFNAVYAEPVVSLTWVTASEVNSDYFTIERTTDEKTFETICQVEAAGQSIQTLDYQATDKNPAPGLSYYRLKQVDLDGTASYSDLVAIKITALAEHISVFPNPVTEGMMTVNVENHPGETIDVSVVDMNGETLFASKNKLDESDQSSIVIDQLDDLPRGIYIVRIAGTSETFNKKITIY